MGHDAGDRVLKAVSDRLASFMRSCDTLARLGGDEFALLVTSGVSKEGVRVVADKMLGVLTKPFALTEGAASVAASVGAALYPQDGDGVQSLIKQADAAMYDAKRQGGNTYRFASPETAPRRRPIDNDVTHDRPRRQSLAREVGDAAAYSSLASVARVERSESSAA